GKRMTRIDAIVRSHSLQCVKDRIVPFGVEGWTVSEVRAFGPQRRHTQNLSRRRVCGDFVPKSMVPILATVDRSGATLMPFSPDAYGEDRREAGASNFERGEEKED